MEYNKIIAVTGLPGLYELLSSKSDGAIVRSLDDKTTRFVSSRVHNFSHLESIEVYTVRDNVNLVDILKAMEVSKDKLPDEKDGAALKNYFTKVFPDLDFTRVYSSDLKKMVKWFVVLKANNIEIKLSEQEEEPEEEQEVAEVEAETPKANKAVEGTKAEKKKEGVKAGAEGVKAGAEGKAEKGAAGSKTSAAEKPAAGRKVAAEAPAKAEKKKAEAVGVKSEAKGKAEKTKKAAASEADKPKKAAKKK
jgi:hypothetical protein